jgi:hypothetical protein
VRGAAETGGEALADGLARSATGRVPPPPQINFFSFFFFQFFVVVVVVHSHRARVASTVFRRHYASVGRLGPFPATARRITENRRPPRRGDHRERGRPVGAGPLVRWRCPRRCVVNVNVQTPFPHTLLLFSLFFFFFSNPPTHSGARRPLFSPPPPSPFFVLFLFFPLLLIRRSVTFEAWLGLAD